MVTSLCSSNASCITSPPDSGRDALLTARLLRPAQQPAELLAPSVDPALHRPLREREPHRHLLVAEPAQVAKHHRLAQLVRQLLETHPQEAAAVLVLERTIGVARGRYGEVEGEDVLHQHFPLPLSRPVVVDAIVAGDAGEPGGKIGVPMELVQAAEDLEEDLLRQVLRLIVLAGELVGDVEHPPPEALDHLLPGRIVLPQASLDELRVGRGDIPLVQNLRSLRRRRVEDGRQAFDHSGSAARGANHSLAAVLTSTRGVPPPSRPRTNSCPYPPPPAPASRAGWDRP